MQLQFENVRCFHSNNKYEIKPITILLGENSTGKSTFLALYRLAWDICRGEASTDIFNEEPFLLGSFEQIASYRGGQSGRARTFQIGLKVPFEPRLLESLPAYIGDIELPADSVELMARFKSENTQPTLEQCTLECGSLKIALKIDSGNPKYLAIKTAKGEAAIDLPFARERFGMIDLFGEIYYLLRMHAPDKSKEELPRSVISDGDVKIIRAITFLVRSYLGDRPYSFSPIRSKPQRTYDPIKDIPGPEGSHVPMLIAKIFSEKTSKTHRILKEKLADFGKQSGLFKSVEVQRKGRKASDPFQIGVKIFGPIFNLVDVGYGVSQVLPIIVDAIQMENNTTFLLQQPEVHLHPKAQAALGSLLGELAVNQNKRFLIETHSDYLVDRIRMDVRDHGRIRPEDVSILYFEKEASGARIHEIGIDKSGNILNAPDSYRDFFMKEDSRLLKDIF